MRFAMTLFLNVLPVAVIGILIASELQVGIRALATQIQRFSVNDGSGFRISVFFKRA
jgi:uncharacterized membrane protein YraQ (UPF0718 family)